MRIFFFAFAMLLTAAFAAVGVFASHHGGYWLAAEIPLLIALILGALFSFFIAVEE